MTTAIVTRTSRAKKIDPLAAPPKGSKINKLVVHVGPHFDELLGALLVLLYAGGYWKLAAKLELVTVRTDEEAMKLAATGTAVLIGIGGGELDEHKATGRIPDVCATELVAKLLGLDQRPAFARILKEANRADTEASQTMMELAQLIKRINYDAKRGTPEERSQISWNVVQEVMPSVINDEIEFHELCQPEFERAGSIQHVGDIDVALVRSELISMSRWCRHEGAGIVVQLDHTDHVRVFTDRKLKHKMPAFMRGCLELELSRDKKLSVEKRQEALAEYDEAVAAFNQGRPMPAASHLYAFFKGGMLLNGSLSHEVQASTITFEDALKIIKRVF